MGKTTLAWLAGIASGLVIWLFVAFAGQFALLTLGLPSSSTPTTSGQLANVLEKVIAFSAFAIGALGGLRIGQRIAGPE